MSHRLPILEAALDLVEEGMVLLDAQSTVLVWNAPAAALTGHLAHQAVGLPCPHDLYRIDEAHRSKLSDPAARIATLPAHGTRSEPRATATALLEPEVKAPDAAPDADLDAELHCPTLVSVRHKLGHTVPAMLRRIALRDAFGHRTGSALIFYPVEETGALPHGETHGAAIECSQAEMEDRLDAAYHQWTAARMPLGLLWITIDQAHSLRRTHGRDACESMLHTIEQTLARQMKPAEVLGRWGDNEFLVLTHERTSALLLEHAARLLGLARTADFRWWGDRVALTLSIGASYAAEADTLQSLLARAQQAMQASQYAGGNHITEGRTI